MNSIPERGMLRAQNGSNNSLVYHVRTEPNNKQTNKSTMQQAN